MQCGGRIWGVINVTFQGQAASLQEQDRKGGWKFGFVAIERRRTSTFHSQPWFFIFFLRALTSPSLLECPKHHWISHLHLFPSSQEVKLGFKLFSCSVVFLSHPPRLVAGILAYLSDVRTSLSQTGACGSWQEFSPPDPRPLLWSCRSDDTITLSFQIKWGVCSVELNAG